MNFFIDSSCGLLAAANRNARAHSLSRAVAKHIGLSATRRETLSWLTLLIMQHGTISLWRLAAYVASVAQTASVQRRFYRFFQFVRLVTRSGPQRTQHSDQNQAALDGSDSRRHTVRPRRAVLFIEQPLLYRRGQIQE